MAVVLSLRDERPTTRFGECCPSELRRPVKFFPRVLWVEKPARIRRIRRVVAHIPVQVGVPRLAPDRILARPPPRRRVVPSRPHVVEVGRRVELIAGALEALAL